jgi:diguanylate cyclase (GGDEF)-like protein
MRRLVLLLLAALTSVRTVAALDPQREPTQYARRTWRAPEALPHDDVSAILQTRDGYLWVGTVEGLARFDGVRSVVFDKSSTKAFTNNWVKALLEDREGRLWVGTFGGGLLCRERGGFVRYDATRGVAQDVVLSLLEDREGRLWAGTSEGVLRLQDGRFVREPGLLATEKTQVRALLQDRAGTLWIGADDALYRWRDGQLSRLTRADGLPDERIMALAEDDGGLWVATERGGIARLAEGRVTTLTRRDGLAHDRIWSLAVDRDQNLWIGTDGGGLQRLSAGRLTSFSTRNGLGNDFVWALREDDEANLWIGTNGGGLTRLKGGRVVPLGKPEGLPSDFAWAVRRTRDGSLWIGTEDAGLVRMREGTWSRVTTREGLATNQAKVLLEGKDGTLWIGGDGGLDRWRDGRAEAAVPRVGGRINALAEGPDGKLWIATDRDGLIQMTPGVGRARAAEGMPRGEVTALLAASDGAIWAGTAGGLARLAEGRVEVFGVKDGLPSTYVTALFEDPPGTVWAGTRGGLTRIRGEQVKSVSARDGLFDDAVMLALPGGDGSLWIGGNRGLFRVARREVEDVMDGRGASIRSLVLGQDDGLRSVEINAAGSSGWRDADGRLWFATRGGVALVDPRNLRPNGRPPRVLIEEVFGDERRLQATGEHLPPSTRRLTFQFTAIDFRSPSRLRFARQLEGFDPDWVDAGTRRSADYTNLPHGHYRFRVKAANEDGVWSANFAATEFEIEPRFSETLAFRALVGLLFVVAVPAFYGVRVRRLRVQKAALEGLVEARTAELHAANDRLAQISREDPLTGLWNRRRLDEALEEEWRRAVRQGTSLGFLLVDVDFFKEYNDRLGHPAGDACLKAVATAIAEGHRRAGELVARYGGEEFAVVLPLFTERDTTGAAEGIRRRVEVLALPHPGSTAAPGVTVSVGVAWCMARASDSPADLVAAADRALYRAKEAGRNRVESALPEAEVSVTAPARSPTPGS